MPICTRTTSKPTSRSRRSRGRGVRAGSRASSPAPGRAVGGRFTAGPNLAREQALNRAAGREGPSAAPRPSRRTTSLRSALWSSEGLPDPRPRARPRRPYCCSFQYLSTKPSSSRAGGHLDKSLKRRAPRRYLSSAIVDNMGITVDGCPHRPRGSSPTPKSPELHTSYQPFWGELRTGYPPARARRESSARGRLPDGGQRPVARVCGAGGARRLPGRTRRERRSDRLYGARFGRDSANSADPGTPAGRSADVGANRRRRGGLTRKRERSSRRRRALARDSGRA